MRFGGKRRDGSPLAAGAGDGDGKVTGNGKGNGNGKVTGKGNGKASGAGLTDEEEFDYTAALNEFVESAPRRTLVPTERERQSDDEADGEAFDRVVEPPKPQTISAGERLRNLLKTFSPKGVAGDGPALPLRVFGALYAFSNWDDIAWGFMVYLFIMPDMDFDYQFMFTLVGVAQFITTASAPFAGHLADHIPRVWMVRIGALISNGSNILVSLAPGPGFLVAARAIGAFGPGIEEPAKMPLLGDYYPVEARPRMFSFLQSLREVGRMMGLLIMMALLMVMQVSWRPVLFTVSCMSTLLALLLFLLKEPVRGELDRKRMGASAQAAKRPQDPASWSEAWRTAASIGTLRRLWYAVPFLHIGTMAVYAVSILITERMARTQGEVGAVALTGPLIYLPLAISPILTIIALTFAAPIGERLMRRRPGRIMVLAGVMMASQVFFLLPLLFVPVRYQLFALIFPSLAGAALGVVTVIQNTLLLSVVPARIRGLGIQSANFFRLIGVIFMPAAGSLIDNYGANAALFILAPVLIIGGIIYASSAANVERDMRAAVAASMADQESRISRAQGANKMIVARDVDVHYGGAQVLFNVDFDVAEGEIVALLGTNGAGKSTLLKAIAGIHPASNGAVFLDGKDITHRPPHLNAHDGVVFLAGGRAIFPTMTVEENLKAAAWLYREDEEYLAARTAEVLGFFPVLGTKMGELAGNMSGGEQQMLALAQCFLMRPRLLMIDELSLGLAPSVVERLLDIVREIHAQGTTIILVEQSVNVALTIAPRAVYMDKGTVRFDGRTEDLLRDHQLVRSVFLAGTGSSALVPLNVKKPTTTTEPEEMLLVDDVHVRYGGVHALSGVTLRATSGQVTGIIGPNGAGKTTLFDVIFGFTPVTEGRVLIRGTDATGLSPDARARLGLARSFQNPRLFPSLTVRETIAVALNRRADGETMVTAAAWAPSVRKAERRVYRRVENLIELLGLGHYANKFVNELSTGSRRMVDLACAVAVEPAVLLLDEPTSGMAQAEIEVLGPVIRRLASDIGSAVIVIEHDMPLVLSISDRIVAMELGTVLADGDPSEVMTDSRVVQSYLNADQSVIARSGDVFTKAMAALGVQADEGPTV